MPFEPFNEQEPVHRHEREHQNLPHWRQWGKTYFVTMRLADSMPTVVREEWQAKRDAWLRARKLRSVDELDKLPEDARHQYHREFTEEFHRLLDAGYGACVLRQPKCAELLLARFLAGQALAYHLDAWVIMPNHAHVLVEPSGRTTLGEIIRHWKGGSAHDINHFLSRCGALWQAEPFDHIVRSELQRNHFRRYIAINPEKAGLRDGFVLGAGAESGMAADAMLEHFGLTRGLGG